MIFFLGSMIFAAGWLLLLLLLRRGNYFDIIRLNNYTKLLNIVTNIIINKSRETT